MWFNRCGYCELRWTVYGYGRCAGRFDSFTQNCRGRRDAAKTEAMKVAAFLDWRDDLATLEEEKNGTVERIEDVFNNNNKSNLSCNFVHANKATFDNAHVTMLTGSAR